MSEDRPLVLQQGNRSQSQFSRSWEELTVILLVSIFSIGPGRYVPYMINIIVIRIIIIILQIFAISLFIQTVFPLRPPFQTHSSSHIYISLLTSRLLLIGGGGGYRNKLPTQKFFPYLAFPSLGSGGREGGGGAGAHTAVSPLLLWLSLW